MKLFVLRHGEAVNSAESDSDFNRNLSDFGRSQADKIGKYLLQHKIEQIISSSAQRTIDTTEIVNDYLQVESVLYQKHLYLAQSQLIFDEISENATKSSCLYVGHNFGISDFVSELTDQNLTLSTCMLVEIELEITDWNLLSKGVGRIINITSPENI